MPPPDHSVLMAGVPNLGNWDGLAGWTPLMIAVALGDAALVRALLADGADANQAIVDGSGVVFYQGMSPEVWLGYTPLMYAARQGNPDLAEALVLGGATVNLGKTAADEMHGMTAAYVAAQQGMSGVLEYLAGPGKADLNQACADGWCPLQIAAKAGREDCVAVLVDNGAKLDHTTDDGWTATLLAAREGWDDIVLLLADGGADLNQTGIDGATAVQFAAENGCMDVLRVLRKNKARLDQPDDFGDTPLYGAAYYGHLGAVAFLARHGADTNHVDESGHNALYHAREHKFWPIAALLSAVESAGSWREWVALRRMPYCLIRHHVSRTGTVCPEDEWDRGLLHFLFGGSDHFTADDGPSTRTRSKKKKTTTTRPAAAGPAPAIAPAMLRAAPDDVFGKIGSFLIG